MGMDVYGNSGNYFRASVWSWHPLWELCEAIAPHITKSVTYAHSNDGDGLNGKDAAALAQALTTALENGHAQALVDAATTVRDGLPDEQCKWCDGTGTRSDAVGVQNGMDKKNWCNACDGKGHRRPIDASYGTDIEELAEFRDFLADSDGFEIR